MLCKAKCTKVSRQLGSDYLRLPKMLCMMDIITYWEERKNSTSNRWSSTPLKMKLLPLESKPVLIYSMMNDLDLT